MSLWVITLAQGQSYDFPSTADTPFKFMGKAKDYLTPTMLKNHVYIWGKYTWLWGIKFDIHSNL